jgi:hypothetical protein
MLLRVWKPLVAFDCPDFKNMLVPALPYDYHTDNALMPGT